MQKWEYMNLEMRFPNILITNTDGSQEEVSLKGDNAADFQKFIIKKLNELGSRRLGIGHPRRCAGSNILLFQLDAETLNPGLILVSIAWMQL